ncbi:MAG: hypothetical protein A2527_06015 [Candidatus Lambdaproteobacteria bacterium RIFOXYD2_FULL_50_16]|uniref:3-deoxy-D-manno-octulosonic acid transferase n=1 Tax=Candidatus Lambdaproteobacteria bacterium RIFOXYD2_FULL_50_16 TaxID=1817772 RepID=A0A1F6G9G0_9PROT|nr:MAG: hypothetical protein A2527_06015 [Candidatus Lambdaproteobacteria bacterium RIFOXYD2_FULL_50_16]
MSLADLLYLIPLVLCSPCLLVLGLGMPQVRRQLIRLFFRMPPQLAPAKAGRVWFHGASLGELGLALDLAAQLQARRPKLEVVFSTNREPALLRGQERGVQIWYKPFDFSWLMRRLIHRLEPDLLVLMETELWPNLIGQFKGPILLLNGRLSDGHFDNYQRFRFLVGPLVSRLDRILAGDVISASRFLELGAQEVSTPGNLKYRLPPAPQPEQLASLRSLCGLGGEPLLVAGSIQPEEVGPLGLAMKIIGETRPEVRLIMVPRHAEKKAEFKEQIKIHHLEGFFASDGPWPGSGFYILDQTGLLLSLYSLADWVFVGGSWVLRGGQNMMEPIGLGKPTATGPLTANFKEPVARLCEAGGLVVVDDAEALARWVLAGPNQQQALAGLEALNGLAGHAWQASLDEIERLLDTVV